MLEWEKPPHLIKCCLEKPREAPGSPGAADTLRTPWQPHRAAPFPAEAAGSVLCQVPAAVPGHTKLLGAFFPRGSFYGGPDGAKMLLNLNVTLVNPQWSSDVSLEAVAANRSCCSQPRFGKRSRA